MPSRNSPGMAWRVASLRHCVIVVTGPSNANDWSAWKALMQNESLPSTWTRPGSSATTSPTTCVMSAVPGAAHELELDARLVERLGARALVAGGGGGDVDDDDRDLVDVLALRGGGSASGCCRPTGSRRRTWTRRRSARPGRRRRRTSSARRRRAAASRRSRPPRSSRSPRPAPPPRPSGWRSRHPGPDRAWPRRSRARSGGRRCRPGALFRYCTVASATSSSIDWSVGGVLTVGDVADADRLALGGVDRAQHRLAVGSRPGTTSRTRCPGAPVVVVTARGRRCDQQGRRGDQRRSATCHLPTPELGRHPCARSPRTLANVARSATRSRRRRDHTHK